MKVDSEPLYVAAAQDDRKENAAMTMSVGEMLWKLGEKTRKDFRGMPDRVALHTPWLVETAGQTWAVATDSKAIVWTKDWDKAKIERCPSKEIEGKLLQIFEPPQRLLPSWDGELLGLQAFCGKPVWAGPCQACKGTVVWSFRFLSLRSAESDYVTCTFCDGDGDASPNVVPGYACEVPVDRNRLARIIEPFAPSVRVKLIADKSDSIAMKLWVLGQMFCICLAQISVSGCDWQTQEEWKTAPRFPQAEVIADAAEAMMR